MVLFQGYEVLIASAEQVRQIAAEQLPHIDVVESGMMGLLKSISRAKKEHSGTALGERLEQLHIALLDFEWSVKQLHPADLDKPFTLHEPQERLTLNAEKALAVLSAPTRYPAQPNVRSVTLENGEQIVREIRSLTEQKILSMDSEQLAYSERFSHAAQKISSAARQFNQVLARQNTHALQSALEQHITTSIDPVRFQLSLLGGDIDRLAEVMNPIGLASEKKRTIAGSRAEIGDIENALDVLARAKGPQSFAKALDQKIALSKIVEPLADIDQVIIHSDVTDDKQLVGGYGKAQSLAEKELRETFPERYDGSKRSVLEVLAESRKHTQRLSELFEKTGYFPARHGGRERKWQRALSENDVPNAETACQQLDAFCQKVSPLANLMQAQAQVQALQL